MAETMLSEGAIALLISYLYYLMLTAHICLFVDMSRLQKHPISRINHFIASTLAASFPLAMTNAISFSSTLNETLAGVGVAAVASTALTLVIQRVIRIE